MDPVIVPAEVAEAFKFYERPYGRFDREQQRLLLMLMPNSPTIPGHPAHVLKEFALNCPTRFMEAILYGCKPHIDIKEEVSSLLNDWLNQQRNGDGQVDVGRFAAELIHHIQKS